MRFAPQLWNELRLYEMFEVQQSADEQLLQPGLISTLRKYRRRRTKAAAFDLGMFKQGQHGAVLPGARGLSRRAAYHRYDGWRRGWRWMTSRYSEIQ